MPGLPGQGGGRYLQEDVSVQRPTTTSPAEVPSVTASNTYQTFTPEQLAELNYDTSTWLQDYASIYNPQGDVTDWSSYAGSPIATGYVDAQGNVVANPFAGAYQAYQMRSQNPVDWIRGQFGENAMTPLGQSAPYQGLNDLISQMKNYQPGNEQQMGYVEKMLGMEPGSFQSTLGGMNQGLAGGIQGMQGYSQQEQSTMQRQIQGEIDNMRNESREIINALAGSGRSIAAYDSMESIAGQIADFGLRSQVEQINNNYARKQLEYQALKDQRDFMVQSGMQGAEQYNAQLQQAWNGAMQGYAQEISTLANENQQYTDLWNQHAEATYKSYMMDLGLTEAAMNQSYELWAQAHMDELLAQSDDLIQELLEG